MKNYQIVYDGFTAQKPANLSLQEVIADIINDNERNEIEPDIIVLPSGMSIEYNYFLAHQFVAEGRISQDKFLKLSTLQ